MSSRRYPRREPPLYNNIHNWDDGFEYISPDASSASSKAPAPPYHVPPAPEAVPSIKTAKYTPRSAQDDFDAVRSRAAPQTEHRRSRRYSPSPPRRRHRSHDRDRAPRYHQMDMDDPPSRHHGTRTKTMPVHAPPTPETSTSPPSHRRRRGHSDSPAPDRRRHHSPGPPRRTRTTHDRSPDRDRHHGRSRRDVPPAAGSAAPKRPGLARSKTTAALGRNMSGLLTNPQFQAAAAAALQAGGMAALKQWKAPGPWVGKKGGQVATAALGAAAMDAFKKGDEAGKGGDGGKRDEAKGGRGGGGARGGGRGEDLGGMIGGLLADQFKGRGRGRK
jgi:hypothetical protein